MTELKVFGGKWLIRSVVAFLRIGESSNKEDLTGARPNLPHSSVAETFTLDVQEAEENFDLALIAALEIDVVPHLGDPRVPDYIITQLARVLLQGSQLRDEDEYQLPSPRSLAGGSSRSSQDYEKVERFGDHSLAMGTTDVGRFLPRERFSYWCFDLLFLICSDTAQG